jgi:CubicO group peptidase (beta-lactamase class C family)
VLQRTVRLIYALLCALVVLPAFAQHGLPADLDSYVARAMQTYQVPGMAIAVVKDDKVVLQKGYGVRNVGDPTPVDAHTLFGIGSTTKAFTVAALANLVDAGKLSWDDPVYERLPGFQMYDPYVSKELRIRDLLCHRSGLGQGEGDLMLFNTTYSRDDLVYRLRFLKPASSFRSEFAYNNLMFVAAGQVVAAVSAKSWDDYLREKIFVPLGMTDTNTSNDAYRPGANWALPHGKVAGKPQVIPPPLMNLDNVGPAGSINSSAADMSRWLLLQLNRGRIPGTDTHLFSEKSAAQMWAQQSIFPTNKWGLDDLALQPHFSGYGMGWFLRDYKGRELVGHPGGVAGYVSRVMLVPEEHLGIVILTNAEETNAYEAVLFHILDGYLGGPTQDYIAAFKAKEARQHIAAEETIQKAQHARAASSKPSLPLEQYAGDYSDPWYGKVTIRRENGALVLNFLATKDGTAELEHWQYDTFKAHWHAGPGEDAFVTFALTPQGSVDHFTMVPVSPLADFSADYQDLYFTPLGTPR